MNPILLISFISFFGYIIYIQRKYGVLPSISDSFYKTENDLLFLAFTLGTALPIIFTTPYNLMIIAGVLLTYVGLSPDFNKDGKKVEDEVHVIAAMGAVIIGMISMVINYKLWYIPIPLVLFLIVTKVFKINNPTFWIEVIAFTSILIGLCI